MGVSVELVVYVGWQHYLIVECTDFCIGTMVRMINSAVRPVNKPVIAFYIFILTNREMNETKHEL